jgi:hypothetical protein
MGIVVIVWLRPDRRRGGIVVTARPTSRRDRDYDPTEVEADLQVRLTGYNSSFSAFLLQLCLLEKK